jgi:hypothetical protein
MTKTEKKFNDMVNEYRRRMFEFRFGCSGCFYWKPITFIEETREIKGVCKKNAPKWENTIQSEGPAKDSEDWCGEGLHKDVLEDMKARHELWKKFHIKDRY